ncbi:MULTISPECIES: hypothetical protein [Oceanobacillus]|uniref:ParA family protein n=1 Tax=Oceanobacillus kimchii TaxID=746691 RepID=A0ABQ5TT55_9BACI|nr:hypothetical protein [Oceanobacillus kimchii]GLO68277.1 hypothetical protein MACH08_40610 [Oceanobacillus kimchii]
MKIEIVSTDETLISLFKRTFNNADVKNVNSLNSISTTNSTTNVLILTDEFLSHTDFVDYNFKKHNYVFYVMRNEIMDVLESTIKAMCVGNEMYYISARLTNEQVVSEIKKVLTPTEKQKKHVYSFFSSVSNVGSTSTSFSTAFSVSENTSAKVGLLILNAWDSGADYINYTGKYLDEVKDSMFNSHYDDDGHFQDLFQEVKKDSLYIMLGNRNTKLERLYTKEEIEKVIQRAEDIFDVVIIDAGCHYDNANIIQALYSSDYHFLVLNQQEKLKRKWEEIYSNILSPLGFKREQFLLVLNRFHNNPSMPSVKDLKQSYQMNVLTFIEESTNGYLAEFNKQSLYQFEDLKYRESVNVIGRTIANSAGFEFVDSSKKKKLFSF